MNKAVYLHLLRTFGRRPGLWFGFVTELTRSLLIRVWVVIIMAQIAANLAIGDFAAAQQATMYFLYVYLVGTSIGTVGDLVALHTENDQYEKLSVDYYRRLTSKDMSFYRNHQTGYLVSLFRQYLDGMMLLVRILRSEVTRIVVSLTVPAIIMAVADWRLGLIAGAIVVIQLIYIVWSSAKATKYRIKSHEIYRKVTGEVADSITNIVAFKSSGIEAQANRRMQKLAREETNSFWLRRRTTVLYDLPRDIITAVGITAAFLVVITNTQHNAESVSLIVLTITYMFQIMRNVNELPTIMTQVDDYVTKVEPTLAYLGDSYRTIIDPHKPKKLHLIKGAISLKHVSFSYPSHHKDGKRIEVFKDLNLDVASGEQIGIVGLSGAGKSTLASLLMRFDDIVEGAITIDGVDIRDVRQHELRQKIAYVPQEPLLFHKSIRDNIAYFATNTSDEAIITAAKAAHAHEFIREMPEGYNTIVGERGIKLSGGQKQRVAIARAVFKNAPILIFDEATSALDSESEKIIQSTLPQIIGKHTAIIIAHRLSTVAGLDRILVMHKGKIIESGTHEQLLQKQGRYYALWQKQITNHS